MYRAILIFGVLIGIAFGQSRYCDYTFTNPSGVISSPNYPSNYPSNTNCKWLLVTTPRHKIKLTFQNFKLESSETCDYDSLIIYDGSHTDSSVLGKFCDVKTPSPILSSGNKIYLVFKTDGAVESKGFNATYRTEGKCTYELSSNMGEIISPNYPNNYTSMTDCAWIISSPPGRIIQLDFNAFDLQPSDDCESDWIAIYDGGSNQALMLGKFCGTEFPQNVSSSGEKMYIAFHSDDSLEEQGFNVTYKTGKCSIRISNTAGEISSPNYPDAYPNMDECEWIFRADYGRKIKLVFNNFRLQPDAKCAYDWVAVYDGSTKEAPMLGKFCGHELPLPLISSDISMLLVFKSDDAVQDTGFRAAYTTGRCMYHLTNLFGEITSQNYPSTYPSNIQCEWFFTTTPGQTYNLSFETIELEGTSPCGLDWVAIYDGHSRESPMLGKFCGTSLPNRVLSTGNTMFVEFRTDGSVQKKGFKIIYSTEGNCTYQITSAFGEINSPDFPNNYPSMANCIWLFSTIHDRKIRLDFTTLHVQQDEECNFDWIAIYDGPSHQSPLIRKICGSELPEPVESSGNSLYLVFRSDGSMEGQGFKATYRSEGNCTYEITSNLGEISSPFYPDNYITMEDCRWLFITNDGYTIKLYFDTFDLQPDEECRYDSIAVYDGNSTQSPMLGKYCGSELPLPIISTGEMMYLVFRSDGSVQGKGFKAKYTRGNCMYSITTPFGHITSPYFPSEYPNSANCEWYITTTPGHIIKLEFNEMDLYGSEPCWNDRISVFDGYNTSLIVGNFCGSEIPSPVRSSDNMMYVVFKTDYSGSKMGFKATYVTEGNCTYQTIGNVGEISTPNYPDSYPNMEDCMWLFTTTPERKIRLNFESFDLQPGDGCAYDWMAIYDVNSSQASLQGKFCGSQLPPSIISSGTMMYMVFKSDSSVQRQGFKASYRTEGKCKYEITTPITHLFSPYFPNNYTSLEECEWVFTANPGERILLDFQSFDLQPDMECNYDWISIHEGNSTESPLRGKFCGSELPPPIISSSNMLYMIFKSDGSVQRQGFSAKYTAGDCFYDIKTPFGEITTPNYPNAYPSPKECTWLLTVDSELVIKLDFEEFDLESSSDCNRDSVAISDGYSMTSPMLGKFCGVEMPQSVTSSGNRMYVVFKSFYTTTKKGFKAIYSSGNCLYSITAYSGDIISPNYPHAYPNMQNCSWTISTTRGHIIKLIFNEFQLDRSEQCTKDWFAIYDGHNTQSPMLEKFCGSSLPSPLLSSTNRLHLAFTSDGAVQGRGFNLTYTTVNCSYQISTPFGEVKSPHFPDYYPKSINCDWLITTTPGHIIKLIFTDFELEYHSYCNHDKLTIFDGKGQESPVKGRYCGSTIPSPIQSSGNSIYMALKTDSSVQKKGFKISYRTEGKCTYQITTTNGIITSPNYPNNYQSMEDCAWHFTTAPGRVIKLNFKSFDLQWDNKCSHDWIAIYDGDDMNSPMLGKFCGRVLPPPIISSSNRMYVMLKSDNSIEKQGFSANYTTGSCIHFITSPSGEITSPNYPAAYLSLVDCSWFFTTSLGLVIKLDFKGFDLQFDKECAYDWIAIYDGDSEESPILGKFCGNEMPHSVQSTGNRMYVVFKSDDSVQGLGFNASYSTGVYRVSAEKVQESSVIIGSVIAAVLFLVIFVLAVYLLRKKMNAESESSFTYSWWKEKHDPDESSLYGQ